MITLINQDRDTNNIIDKYIFYIYVCVYIYVQWDSHQDILMVLPARLKSKTPDSYHLG